MPDPVVGWTDRALTVDHLGLVPYDQGVALQRRLVDERRAGSIGDRLLLLEHPHVVTQGSGTEPEHVLGSEAELASRGIALFESGRGGDVTYHGPGQLVGYPILDLKPDRRDLHAYLRSLEEVLIRTLEHFGIQGSREPGLTGVWTGGEKVAAMGIRVSSGWITSHGFALNVNTDLSYFDVIVPCGIQDRHVTSLARLLGREVDMAEAARAVVTAFETEFGYGSVDDSGGANSK